MDKKTRNMCFIALMTAVLCAAAPISLPIGPIPISLATLIVYLAGALLGFRKGSIAVLLYILIGAVGVPVFSGYSAGFAKLAGPTGGFIVGYIPCAAIVGFGVDRFGHRTVSIGGKGFSPVYPISMVLGTIVLYALGTIWFMIQSGSALGTALGACVFPFLPGDTLKIIVATILGEACRSRLCAAGILRAD